MDTIDTIIAPVDLEEHTDKLIEYAAYMADRLSATLILLHVVEKLRSVGDMVIGTSTIEEYNQKRLEHAKHSLEKYVRDFPQFTAEVRTGEIVDEIIQFAEEKKAKLVIIGTHGSKGLEKLLLGSVAERVVKSSHCPTLVMNPYKR